MCRIRLIFFVLITILALRTSRCYEGEEKVSKCCYPVMIRELNHSLEVAAMIYIGSDVSEKSSYIYVTDGKGKKIESREISTDKDGYRQYFKKWAGKQVKVAVEAGGHSRWIHDTLKKLGISVYVVNPNKVKLIAKNKKKTDKIDAEFLAKLLRIDELPERVHVAEGDSRELRDLLRSRYQLVTSTTCLMNHLRGMLRQEGIKFKARAFNDETIF